jgi:CheY-like chemotaxis protein
MPNDTQLDTLRGTILAVDDSPTIRKLVSMTMEGQGYRVVVAADGIEALAILKEEQPDLILCDVAMPKLDGYQLCKIIKSSTDTKHVPVVMLSGKDGLFDKVRGKMAGCASYITKPFEPDLLISEVRKYVKPALIPMSPYKPKKKATEVSADESRPAAPFVAAPGHAAGDRARQLSDQLAGLVMPNGVAASPASGVPDSIPGPISQAPESGDDASPAQPQETPLPSPFSEPVNRTVPKPASVSALTGQGTVELDKLLAELERDDEESTRPREPFRSRCPGCRTVFRNVRSEDYDKYARCKKCTTRFHLGSNLVI